MAWLRLYDDILDDPKIQLLSDRAFRMLINLWCLSKRNGGVITDDLASLSFSLRCPAGKVRDAMRALISAGLIEKVETGYTPHNWNGRQYQSDVSTERVKRFRERNLKQDETVSETATETAPETDTESETEAETETETDKKEMARSAFADDCPEAVLIFNSKAESVGWPEAQRITKGRKAKLTARLAECGGLDGWRGAIEKAGESDFLTGRSERTNGHEGWTPNLDFFLQESSFTKLMEGQYDNRAIGRKLSAHDRGTEAAKELIANIRAGKEDGDYRRNGAAGDALPESGDGLGEVARTVPRLR